MRHGWVVLGVVSVALASCGSKQLALPSDAVDRAATCAVVSAADSRSNNPNAKGDLDFDAQTRIIHYAMLAGATGKDFSASQASAVVQRMSQVEKTVTDGDWESLRAPCSQAFPAVGKVSGVALPKGDFEAKLGCYALSEFLVRSVSSRDVAIEKQMLDLGKIRRDLDEQVGSGLRARGAGSFEKGRAMKNAALVEMANLGSPAEITRQCKARFT